MDLKIIAPWHFFLSWPPEQGWQCLCPPIRIVIVVAAAAAMGSKNCSK